MEEIVEFMKVGAWQPEEGEEPPPEDEEGAEEAFNPEEQVHVLPLEGSINEIFNRSIRWQRSRHFTKWS